MCHNWENCFLHIALYNKSFHLSLLAFTCNILKSEPTYISLSVFIGHPGYINFLITMDVTTFTSISLFHSFEYLSYRLSRFRLHHAKNVKWALSYYSFRLLPNWTEMHHLQTVVSLGVETKYRILEYCTSKRYFCSLIFNDSSACFRSVISLQPPQQLSGQTRPEVRLIL